MMFAFLEDVDAKMKWAVDQGAMAVMLFGLAGFAAWVSKRLVDKWIVTLTKTDEHLDATTKVMGEVSVTLTKINDNVNDMRPMIQEINRNTQPKGPTTG